MYVCILLLEELLEVCLVFWGYVVYREELERYEAGKVHGSFIYIHTYVHIGPIYLYIIFKVTFYFRTVIHLQNYCEESTESTPYLTFVFPYY